MIKATVPTWRERMNKLEAAYADHLDLLRAAGEIRLWAYESLRLRLAEGTFYTPDFCVVRADEVLEIHETKGFMREAARVRLNVAAELHPFVFKLIRQVKGGWTEELISCGRTR